MPETKTTDAVAKSTRAKHRSILWLLPFFAVLVPIVLLSLYTIDIATESVQKQVEAENIAATSNLAQHVSNELTQTTNLALAMASGSGTVTAAKNADPFVMSTRLKYIVASYAKVENAYVTDKNGIVWSAFPRDRFEGNVILNEEEWFTKIVNTEKTAVSSVRTTPSGTAVVAIGVPILDGSRLLGVLVFEYDVDEFEEWLQTLQLSGEGYAFMLDHTGTVVAHPKKQLQLEYGQVPEVQSALRDESFTVQYTDPANDTTMIATFLPLNVGNNIWVLIAQQPIAQAYAQLHRVTFNIGIAGFVLSLCTLALIVQLARTRTRNVRLNTELNAKNQILRETASIVSSSNDAIIGLTLDWHIKTWNTGATNMYGHIGETIVGQGFSDLFSEESRIAEMEDISRSLQSGEDVKQQEMLHKRLNGEQFYASVTISHVLDEAGKSAGYSAIVRDISARKEVEQMKNDFISFVSHQLKAPITAIKFIIEGILDGDDGEITPELEADVKKLQEVNASNYGLVTDILNASRIDRGVIAVDAQPHPLKMAVDRAIRDYIEPAKQANLYLKVEEPEGEIVVDMDVEKVAESISNSVSNSIKYTGEGGITITIYTKDGFGVVDVTDTGKGMDAEMIGRLFTRDKVIGSNTNPQSSTGLGLYIAKNFMELHGGDIVVESQPGNGTTFRYTVPLSKK